jgi:hypothetical protein
MKALESFVVLPLLVATTALAAQEPVVIQEATGEAAIVSGNRQKATEEARNAALRFAVEQVAGLIISADTLTQNSQLVSDRVFANSSGYVKSFQVLETTEESGVIRVKVRAQVSKESLDRDLQAVQSLVRRLGSPKLVILTQEQTIDAKGAVSSSGLMAGVLGEAFKKDGWTIIDPAFAAGKLTLSSGVGLGTVEAKEIGDLSKADYIIYGKVSYRQEPPGAFTGNVAFTVKGDYELAVFSTDSGNQLATLNGTISNTGVLNYERTAHVATRNKGTEIVAETRRQIYQYLSNSEQNGSQYVMKVLGLANYAAVQSFKQHLSQGVSGVREVRPGKFGKGKAEFDVIFVGTTDDLAGTLSGKNFKGRKLNVTGISGNTIEVSVAR